LFRVFHLLSFSIIHFFWIVTFQYK
jgi:hypothetical protein